MILFVHVDGLHADLFRNEVVVDAPRLIADVAVLQVTEKAQPPGYGPRRAGEEVGVVLVYVVVVPAAADLAAFQSVHPVERTPVGAGVVAVRTAEGEVEVAHRVGRRGVQTSEVVAHDLLADQIGFFSGGNVGRDIEVFGERAPVLILLVEAVAVGVESRGVEGPLFVETVGEHQLVVDLQVVVRLVVVIADCGALHLVVLHIIIGVRTVRGVVHALGLEPPAVETHLLLRYSGVGEAGLGLAAERNQLEHRVAVVVSRLEHVGFEVRGSAVDVALRPDVRQPCVEGPVAAQQARREVHGLLVGVVRTVGERCVASEFGLQGVG